MIVNDSDSENDYRARVDVDTHHRLKTNGHSSQSFTPLQQQTLLTTAAEMSHMLKNSTQLHYVPV